MPVKEVHDASSVNTSCVPACLRREGHSMYMYTYEQQLYLIIVLSILVIAKRLLERKVEGCLTWTICGT